MIPLSHAWYHWAPQSHKLSITVSIIISYADIFIFLIESFLMPNLTFRIHATESCLMSSTSSISEPFSHVNNYHHVNYFLLESFFIPKWLLQMQATELCLMSLTFSINRLSITTSIIILYFFLVLFFYLESFLYPNDHSKFMPLSHAWCHWLPLSHRVSITVSIMISYADIFIFFNWKFFHTLVTIPNLCLWVMLDVIDLFNLPDFQSQYQSLYQKNFF